MQSKNQEISLKMVLRITIPELLNPLPENSQTSPEVSSQDASFALGVGPSWRTGPESQYTVEFTIPELLNPLPEDNHILSDNSSTDDVGPSRRTGSKKKYTDEQQIFINWMYHINGPVSKRAARDHYGWNIIAYHYHIVFPDERRSVSGLNTKVYHDNSAKLVIPQVLNETWAWKDRYVKPSHMDFDEFIQGLVKEAYEDPMFHSPKFRAMIRPRSLR